MERTYIAIDLKSFYASVECAARGLDPLTTNLVVADVSRTEKTICLAVSPSLKAYAIPGRARLFEVVSKVKEVNADRLRAAKIKAFSGASADAAALAADPTLAVDYIAAVPRMALYMEVSSKIYQIYLKYVAPEDIHVYSIDEVFMDVTTYLHSYGLTARELAEKMIKDVLSATGITATAGIASNLFLCKVAMDIVAKHVAADENGVRIAELTEYDYRRQLWTHTPLTDFWRIGRGTAKKLEAHGLFTMGDIARCSVGSPNDYYNEELLYRLFGVNAELIIDHAWGYEPTTMADIKAYTPEDHSLGSGQVLSGPTDPKVVRGIVREMAEALALSLVEKRLMADQLILNIGYDRENLSDPKHAADYKGEVNTDFYGRTVPKPAHGSCTLPGFSSSTKEFTEAAVALCDRILDPNLLCRRIAIAANHVTDEIEAKKKEEEAAFGEQFSLFTTIEEKANEKAARETSLKKERRMQEAELAIRKKFGKNALLKGSDLTEGSTTRERNAQIGGHKA